MRNRSYFLFISIAVLIISTVSSCSKEDGSNNTNNNPACSVNNFGYLTVSNSSNNPYRIYVNNSFKGQVGGKSILQDIVVYQANGVQFRAEQVSGYVLYPTIVNTNANVIKCSTYSWQIP